MRLQRNTTETIKRWSFNVWGSCFYVWAQSRWSNNLSVEYCLNDISPCCNAAPHRHLSGCCRFWIVYAAIKKQQRTHKHTVYTQTHWTHSLLPPTSCIWQKKQRVNLFQLSAPTLGKSFLFLSQRAVGLMPWHGSRPSVVSVSKPECYSGKKVSLQHCSSFQSAG